MCLSSPYSYSPSRLLLQLALDCLWQPTGIGESLRPRCVSRLRHGPSGCHAAASSISLSFLPLLCCKQPGGSCWTFGVAKGKQLWRATNSQKRFLWAVTGRHMGSWSRIPFPSEQDDSGIAVKNNCRTLSGNAFFIDDKKLSFCFDTPHLNVVT